MATTATRTATTTREPLWTRNYILTLLSLHLFFLVWAMLFSTLPLYLEDARKWQIGWVVSGVVGIASLSVRMHSGRMADRRGRRPSMTAGAAATALLMAAHALTNSVLWLTPIRFLFGAAMCVYSTAGMAMLADTLPATRRGEGLGWYGLTYTATNVYGPWLGLGIAEAIGLRPFFLVAAAVLAGCTAVSALVREARRPAPPTAAPARLISRPALLPGGVFASLTIAFSVLPAFLVLYALQRDLGDAGLYFFIQGVALLVTRALAGAAADRFGRAVVTVPGLVLAAAGMSLLALAGGPALFYLAALVFGAGFALGHTGLTLLAMDRAPASERGAAMATFSLAWDAGTLGTFALGFVADVISLQALFLAAAVLPAIALLVFASVTRKR
jgi:MFS family permease